MSAAGDEGCAAARAELAGFIEAMDEDEQCELIALAWVGRGKFTREEWKSALVEARNHLKQPTADYLLAQSEARAAPRIRPRRARPYRRRLRVRAATRAPERRGC